MNPADAATDSGLMDPAIWISAGAIALLLILSAFFSGSETALTASSRAKLHGQAEQGSRGAKTAMDLTDDGERLIGAILLGNNLVNILATSIATSLLISIFGATGMANVIATAVMTILVLVFAEVTPKTAAIARPEGFAMFIAPLMRWVVLIFAPVTRVVQIIVRGFLHLFGLDVSRDSAVLSAHEELRGAVDLHHSEGRVDKEARDLIRGALELDELRVEEVMIHRKSIETLDIEMPKEELIQQALQSPHTRLPLYRGDPDNIIGVLHAKDLLRALWEAGAQSSEIDFDDVARDPYFVPETTTLQEQLDAFKLKQEHFALVVDEYGALMGLVTLEDILEEIVGEIEDEYDSPVQGVRPQADGSLNVDGDVTIRDLNRAMDWTLPDDEAVTVAGLIIHEAQCIPDVGQTFSFHGFLFKILRRRRNQITGVKITALVEAPAS